MQNRDSMSSERVSQNEIDRLVSQGNVHSWDDLLKRIRSENQGKQSFHLLEQDVDNLKRQGVEFPSDPKQVYTMIEGVRTGSGSGQRR